MKNVLKVGFIFLLVSCSNEIELNKTVERNGLVYEINNTTPYTGTVFSYHENGQIKSKEIYKDGLKSGVNEYFYSNGQVKQISNFFEGVLQDGQHTQYFKDGKVAKTWKLLNGKLEGVEEIFYENGQLETRENYLLGELEGVYEQYNEDGSLNVTGTIKEGLETNYKLYSYYDNGDIWILISGEKDKNKNEYKKIEYFYENGKHEYFCNYKNEKKHGLCEEFYENGQIKETATYKEDIPDGILAEYKEDGTKKFSETYDNGKLNGSFEYYRDGELFFAGEYKTDVNNPRRSNFTGGYTRYYKNGQLQEKATVKNGLLHGPREFFHENGNRHTTNFYKNGLYDGLYNFYDYQGRLTSSRGYKNGERDGTWTEYDSRGNIISQKCYMNGKEHTMTLYYCNQK
jgi:YD repeat-containing protein